MAKFDLRSRLVDSGKSGDAPQPIMLKEGKRTIATIKLYGRKAMKAKSAEQVVGCIKEEDEIEGTVAGVVLVEGKAVTGSRKDFWDAEDMAEIFSEHVGLIEEVKPEPKKEEKPGANRTNGQAAAAPTGK